MARQRHTGGKHQKAENSTPAALAAAKAATPPTAAVAAAASDENGDNDTKQLADDAALLMQQQLAQIGYEDREKLEDYQTKLQELMEDFDGEQQLIPAYFKLQGRVEERLEAVQRKPATRETDAVANHFPWLRRSKRLKTFVEDDDHPSRKEAKAPVKATPDAFKEGDHNDDVHVDEGSTDDEIHEVNRKYNTNETEKIEEQIKRASEQLSTFQAVQHELAKSRLHLYRKHPGQAHLMPDIQEAINKNQGNRITDIEEDLKEASAKTEIHALTKDWKHVVSDDIVMTDIPIMIDEIREMPNIKKALD